MLKKLEGIEKKYNEIEDELSSPDIVKDMNKFKMLSESLKKLSPIVKKAREYKKTLQEIDGNRELLKDEELKDLAKEELKTAQENRERLEQELKILLIPKDPMDDKDIILEIRAGTGGEEAALFAQDLFRMYTHYVENHKFKIEIINSSISETGGIRELIANVKGKGAYSKFKYESGTHRVQRVPSTESQGRVHTSAATVAVLPEAEDVDIEIKNEDLRIDVFRATGHGGQCVNTTDSAVRITHLPTNLVVTCQDEKSQLKNKNKAMKVLRARLYDMYEQEKEKERSDKRKQQIGTGDRSGRVRTYNFPQGRVTDHRIGLTLYKLDAVMDGDLDELIDALTVDEQAKKLETEEIE